MYRTRRRVLRRLVIPGALAAIMVGAAIGAAASYLTTRGDTGPAHAQAGRPTASGRAGSAAGRAATPPRPPRTAPTSPSTTGPGAAASATATGGAVLNDHGYALIQHGEYAAAIPLLQRAVAALRGLGPSDPHEAYANYNLGYALLEVGDCDAAIAPLELANRLETSPLVDVAIRRATACARQGS